MRTVFPVPRPLLLVYAAVSLAFSLALLQMARARGGRELALWLVVWCAVGITSLRWPPHGPLVAGFAAFALGFVRTWRSGPTLDLGLALVCLAAAIFLADLARRRQAVLSTDVAGLLLLAISVWSCVSLAFALDRIRGFAPAPGFAYHVYRFSPAGLASDEAVVRAVVGAACVFVWYGLYEWGRRASVERRGLAIAVFGLLLADSAALLVQRHVDYRFLHPVGLPSIGRLNGVTSFCYALGDGLLALFLLLPLWGGRKGRGLALGVASVAMMLHGVAASGSRTPLVGMTLAAGLWAGSRVVALLRQGRRRQAVLAVAGSAGVLVLLLAAYARTPADPASALGRLKDGIERQGVIGHLVATRWSSYPLIGRMLAAHPLAGVGVGLYAVEVDKQRALLLPGLQTDPFLLVSYAPNQFLNTGAELGIPAMLALAAALLLAAAAGLASPTRRDLGLAVLVLFAALQFGPSFYNSEALVFQWLLVGLASSAAAAQAGRTDGRRRVVPLTLAAALVLGLVGQWLARPALAIDTQWRSLRWRLNVGMLPPEPAGQWTSSEATFSVKTDARRLLVRWHAGDPRASGYRPQVTFYVDGVEVESGPALSGRIRESRLALPPGPGFKRVSVRVVPPFMPARLLGGDDDRALGIFLHAVRPEPVPTVPGAPAAQP